MKTINAYETSDGRKFFDAAAARRHEAEVAEIAAVMPPRVPVDPNGNSYYQHPAGTRAAMLAACEASPYKHPRHADDSGSPWWPLGWSRMYCLDDNDREWGQPYFAKNPKASALAVR